MMVGASAYGELTALNKGEQMDSRILNRCAYCGKDIKDQVQCEIEDVFDYEYVGGGYFRKKGVPTGQKADIIHGIQAIEYLFNKMVKR